MQVFGIVAALQFVPVMSPGESDSGKQLSEQKRDERKDSESAVALDSFKVDEMEIRRNSSLIRYYTAPCFAFILLYSILPHKVCVIDLISDQRRYAI